MKIILGLGSLILALFLGLFSLRSFSVAEFGLTFGVVFFAGGFAALGILLLVKRRLPLASRTKVLIVAFLGLSILAPLLLNLQIRHERKKLQARAKAFLERPVPKLLLPDAEGYVGENYQDTNSVGVLGESRLLIGRYAKKGRIRWSASIQGQFAVTSHDLWVGSGPKADAIKTNEEVRLYMAERNAILAKEWNMGFWQWVEDMMESVSPIPEHEEEDQVSRAAQRVYGIWTNQAAESMAISNNGTFSAIWRTQNGTNIFVGNHVYRGRDSVLEVIKHKPGNPQLEDGDLKELKIIHADSHSLIYELDGHTNTMSR